MRTQRRKLVQRLYRSIVPSMCLMIATLLSSNVFPAAQARETLEHRVQRQYGPDAAARAQQLTALLSKLQFAPVQEQLELVNAFFNDFVYSSDQVVWGRGDHWASPEEFIGRNAGDCEDFAIAKYYALRELGLAATSMQIAYVHDIQRHQYHIVLEVDLGAGRERVILDNAQPLVMRRTQRRDLVKVVGFGEKYVTVALPDGGEQAFLRSGRWSMRQWDSVLKRSQSMNSISDTKPGLQKVSWNAL